MPKGGFSGALRNKVTKMLALHPWEKSCLWWSAGGGEGRFRNSSPSRCPAHPCDRAEPRRDPGTRERGAVPAAAGRGQEQIARSPGGARAARDLRDPKAKASPSEEPGHGAVLQSSLAERQEVRLLKGLPGFTARPRFPDLQESELSE